MSDMFKYNVNISPNPANIDLKVQLSDTALTATISSVPELSYTLRPDGDFIQKIISAVLDPIAQLISLSSSLKKKPQNMLQGKSETLVTIGSYTADDIVINPKNLALGSYTAANKDMLEVTGSLTLSPKS